MIEPSDRPGADIRAGDKVTHRETGSHQPGRPARA